MPKRRALVLLAAAFLCISVAPAAAHAGVASGTAAYLDELSLDLYRAPDSLALATGLNLGNVRRGGFYWYVGGRLSWLDVLDPGPEDSGWGAGLVGGFGTRPDRLASPVFRVEMDRAFGMERYEWRSTVSAGVRIRVFRSVPEHVAISVSAFRVDWMGKSGVPDDDDYGVALFYSAAVFERR